MLVLCSQAGQGCSCFRGHGPLGRQCSYTVDYSTRPQLDVTVVRVPGSAEVLLVGLISAEKAGGSAR